MKILRKTGKYLKRNMNIYLSLFVSFIIISAFLYLTWLQWFPIHFDLGRNEFVRGCLFLYFGVMGAISWVKYRKYKQGLDGEILVSKYLENNLKDVFYLINDVKRSDRNVNIDHIVLSLNGLFVLETKNYRGDVIFYGDKWNQNRWSPVSQVKSNAWALWEMISSSKILSSKSVPYIKGVVVFPSVSPIVKSETSAPVMKLSEVPDYIRNYGDGYKQYLPSELDAINELILGYSQDADLLEKSFARTLWEIIRELF